MLNTQQVNTQRITPNTSQADILLSNKIINKLCYTNAKVYYFIYSILILYFFSYGIINYDWYILAIGITIGLLIWTFIEYLMHRFSFHFETENAIGKIIIFIFHDVHHAYPQEISRSITPPMYTLPLALFFYFVFKLLFGDFYFKAVFLGFIIGYVLYSITHDATHHLPMNYPLIKNLKKNHMRHHYFDEAKNFGVTTSLWDHVFGTFVKLR